MNARQLEEHLYGLLHEAMRARGDLNDPLHDLAAYVAGVALVETFEEADLLTADCGLVITMEDYGEFHVTITQRC